MPTQLPITGVAHVGLRVFDLERSRRFYEALGFEFILGPVGPEPIALMTHPGGVELNLILNATTATDSNVLLDIDVRHAGYTHVALSIEDAYIAVAALREAGIPIRDGPIDYPGGAKGIFIRDPDLNVFELYQPARS